MLSCRNCKETDCGCKNDMLKGLVLIGNYITSGLQEHIEDLIDDEFGECKDYKGE